MRPLRGSLFFDLPQTDVPGRNSDLSRGFNIFLRKCGRGEHPFGFPNSTGRGGTSRPDFPTGIPHMQIFCYF